LTLLRRRRSVGNARVTRDAFMRTPWQTILGWARTGGR
jgi:hypothetical protein